MKLSEMIIAEMGAWPRTSSLCRVLDECLDLARRYEDAPVATPAMLGGVLMLSDIDAECLRLTGQRVRIVLDKEG